MGIPTRTLTIVNGGNGVIQGTAPARMLLGCCSTGQTDQVYSFTSPGQAVATLGVGPLVDAVGYELNTAGGIVYAIRVPDQANGSITTAAPYAQATNAGTCVASGSPNDRYDITVKITTTGGLGAAVFKYATDANPDDLLEDYRSWSKPTLVPAGGTFVVPSTGVTLTFANAGGGGFTVGDLFHFMCAAPTCSQSSLVTSLGIAGNHVPYWDRVHIIGECSYAVAVGIDTVISAWPTTKYKFKYCLLNAVDVPRYSSVTAGGTSPPTLTLGGTPVASWNVKVKCTLGGARGTATIQYSLDGGNTYSADILTAAANNIGTTGMIFNWASATFNVDNTWVFDTWDKNEAYWISNASYCGSYANFASDRTLICAGMCEVTLANGRQERLPASLPFSSLCSKTSISTDLGQIYEAGTLPGVSKISHDESTVPGLDDLGFATTRTWQGTPGLYATQGRIKCASGSDYDLIQYRRVMDEACRVLDQAQVSLVNRKVRVDLTTGFIDERDAVSIDRYLLTRLEAAIVTPGHASGCTVRCRRNENILSTRLISIDFEIIGLAYLKTIAGTIGFKNPATIPSEA